MAELKRCPVCGRDISSEAKMCPGCGQTLRTTARWKTPLLAFGALAAVGAAGTIYLNGQRTANGVPLGQQRTASAVPQPNATARAAAVPTSTLKGERYVVGGALGGMKLVALSEVPSNTKGIVVDENCEAESKTPVSEGAKLAARRGWNVLDEFKVGLLKAISTSRGQEWWMGRGCFPRAMSVMLFDGSELVAVAYADATKDEFGGLLYAEARPDGALRLSGVTDLKVTENTIALHPLPPFDIECSGRVKAPRIEDLQYNQARRKLLAQGWKPLVDPSAEDDSSMGEFHKLGMVEVSACSGTGLGYCAMEFQAASGDRLKVITSGGPAYDQNDNGRIDADEFPGVEGGAAVTCRKDIKSS